MSNWCPKCEWAGNDSEALYCRLCGAPLMQQKEIGCPSCGNGIIVPSDTRFCDSCGKELFPE